MVVYVAMSGDFIIGVFESEDDAKLACLGYVRTMWGMGDEEDNIAESCTIGSYVIGNYNF